MIKFNFLFISWLRNYSGKRKYVSNRNNFKLNNKRRIYPTLPQRAGCDQFLCEFAMQIFRSPGLVAKPKLKNSICPTIH